MFHIWSDKAFKGNRCNCIVGTAIFAWRVTWNYVFNPFKLLFKNVQRIHNVLLHSSDVFMSEFCHDTTLPSVVVSVVVFIRTVVVLNNIFWRKKLLRLQDKYKSIFNRTVAEFKEFDRRFKFKPRFKYGWFHLKLY